MAEETGQERTETATSKRRNDFREKGQVTQSKEIGTAALLTASLALWVFYAKNFWSHLELLYRTLLHKVGTLEVTPASVSVLSWELGRFLIELLWPIFLLTLIVGFFSSFLQVGPLFSTKVFMPDLAKFNPIKGMAKFVSKRSAVELIKSLSKVLLIAFVAYWTVRGEFETALTLTLMGLEQSLIFLGHVSYLVFAKSCGIMIVLAAVDFAFSKYEMEERMKMTKQEIKEEHKEMEGNPEMKSRIRAMQMQAARRRMMAAVPKADVIITNPTHLSIALSYERGTMGAPVIVAKGADHLAFKIREIARAHAIPIIENKPVARALYKQEIGEQVPEEMFTAVAEILAYVYGLKKS
jgi:flagellar biosynthetic protein FlhB